MFVSCSASNPPSDMDFVGPEPTLCQNQHKITPGNNTPLCASAFGQWCMVAHAIAEQASLSNHDPVINAESGMVSKVSLSI
jgi:hypothetical protein